MKKLLSIFGIILFIGSLAISSCNTNNRICPAYPPSVLNSDVQDQINNQVIETENIEIENNNNL